MTAFSAAMERVFADRNLAVEALWFAGGAGPGHPVRLIRKTPDAITPFGAARILSDTTTVDVRVAEMPSPAPGDRIVIGAEGFTIQGEPLRDRERLIWTLDLQPE